MSIWAENIAHLNITSWVGISIAATHCYGKLYYKDDRIEITKVLTKREADLLNKKNGSRRDDIGSYFKDDEVTRFDTEEEIINLTIKLLEKNYPQVDLLLLGSGSSLSCQKALWAKDKKIFKRINELYKEADSLYFYNQVKNYKRVNELDDEFEKIVGLEILK